MKAELFYFDDCPSYRQAEANLKEALRSEGLPETVEMVEVTSEEDAQRKRFIGSPTIRIDGVDLEGPEADAKGYGYGCRVYSSHGGFAGWPSVERMRQALRGFQRNSQSGRGPRSPSRTEEVHHDQAQPHCDCQQTP